MNDENLAINPKVNKVLQEGVLKYGKVSDVYLMKKLKINRIKAEAIILNTKHECVEWDFLEIDCSMIEFQCCKCFTT